MNLAPRALAGLLSCAAAWGASDADAQSMPLRQIDVVEPARLGLAADRDAGISPQSISDDGRWVVFRSAAGNLVAGDDDRREDIFLLDRQRDELTRITDWLPRPEPHAGRVLSLPIISGDGRWVFYVAGSQVDRTPYRYSVESGRTEPVADEEGRLWRLGPTSRDGRYMLVRGGNNALLWLRRDLLTGTEVLVSRDGDGQPTGVIGAALSPSGRFACHVSEHMGVVLIDLDGEQSVRRVDIAANGARGDEHLEHCMPSDDGERVAFVSRSWKLIAPPLPLSTRVYVWERARGHVVVASPLGAIGSPVTGLFVSNDGRQFSFALTDSQARPVSVVRWTPETGPQPWVPEFEPSSWHDRTTVSASGDGRWLLFEARRDLPGSPEPSNGVGTALYLASGDGDPIELVSRARHVPLPSLPRTAEMQHGWDCGLRPVLSHDGRLAVYVSTDLRTYLSPGNDVPQIVLRDLHTGRSELISVDADGRAGTQAASLPSLSADGRFVVYSARAPFDGPPWIWPAEQVFLRDRVAGTTRHISINAAGVRGDGNSLCAVVSGDGRRVAFQSRASNLLPDVRDAQDHVLLWRAEHDDLVLLSRAVDGRAAHGSSPSMSNDGRRVVFESRANDLVHGDANPGLDLFLHDEATPGLGRVTASGVGLNGRADSRRPWLSADGRWLAFESSAAFPGMGPPGQFHVLVLDLQTGALDWVNAYPESAENPVLLGAEARWPSLSADGRRVLMQVHPAAWTRTFESWPEDVAELTLMDRDNREVRSIRIDPRLEAVDRALPQAVVSGDGRFVSLALSHPDGLSMQRAGPWPLRTAMWWQPSESGWGLASFDQGSALVPIWYTNGIDGRPTWFLVPGLSPLADGTLSGPLLSFRGRPWSSTGPMTSEASVVGEARLHFTVDDRLRFGWRVGSVEGARTLLPFELPQRIDCRETDDADRSGADNVTDIWYAGPHESGWGVQLFHAGPTLALVWYTYDGDGRATWFVGVTEAVSARQFAGELFRPRPGLPLGAIRDVPASSGADRVGEVELAFADGERGEFLVRIEGLERRHRIERLRFGAQASVCASAPHR